MGQEGGRRQRRAAEKGAEGITKLVTGLYGVLFAVLAFADAPDYLARPEVRWIGAIAIAAFFLALVAALTVQFPFRNDRDEARNVTQIAAIKAQISARKESALRTALVAFLVGIAALALLLLTLLFQ